MLSYRLSKLQGPPYPSLCRIWSLTVPWGCLQLIGKPLSECPSGLAILVVELRVYSGYGMAAYMTRLINRVCRLGDNRLPLFGGLGYTINPIQRKKVPRAVHQLNMDWSYDEKSVILYALSVGCRRQQTEYVS